MYIEITCGADSTMKVRKPINDFSEIPAVSLNNEIKVFNDDGTPVEWKGSRRAKQLAQAVATADTDPLENLKGEPKAK